MMPQSATSFLQLYKACFRKQLTLVVLHGQDKPCLVAKESAFQHKIRSSDPTPPQTQLSGASSHFLPTYRSK